MKKFLKLISYGFLGLIVLVGLSFAYDAYFPLEDKARERTFNQRLEEKIVAGEEKIYLKDLTDFEWDRVCMTSVYWKEPNLLNYQSVLDLVGKQKIDFYVPKQHQYESGMFFIQGREIIPIYTMEESLADKLSWEHGIPCILQMQNPQISIFKNNTHNTYYWRFEE